MFQQWFRMIGGTRLDVQTKWLSWEHFSKICLLEGLPFIPLMTFFSISLRRWPECDQKTAVMQDNIYWNWEYCFFVISSTMSVDAGLAVLHHQSQHNFSLCLSVIKRFRFFPKFLFPDHLIYLLSKCFLFYPRVLNSCLVDAFGPAKSVADITRSRIGTLLHHSGHPA